MKNKKNVSERILHHYYATYELLNEKAVSFEPITTKEALFYCHSWEDQHNQIHQLMDMTNEHIVNALNYTAERLQLDYMNQETKYDWTLSVLLLFNEGVKRNHIPIQIFDLNELIILESNIYQNMRTNIPNYKPLALTA